MSNDKVHLGHTARKRFGQNFLHDHYVIDAIVAAIHPQEGQVMVEIGPGLGALTEPVASQISHMHVVELDRDLAERLRHHPVLKDKLTIHEADAMKFDFNQLKQDGTAGVRQSALQHLHAPDVPSVRAIRPHQRHAFHAAKRSGRSSGSGPGQ